MWFWKVNNKDAIAVAMTILPFLCSRRRARATEMIQLWKNIKPSNRWFIRDLGCINCGVSERRSYGRKHGICQNCLSKWASARAAFVLDQQLEGMKYKNISQLLEISMCEVKRLRKVAVGHLRDSRVSIKQISDPAD
jgi:DNA-directed RNA polymerase specialized sigma24 family protein